MNLIYKGLKLFPCPVIWLNKYHNVINNCQMYNICVCHATICSACCDSDVMEVQIPSWISQMSGKKTKCLAPCYQEAKISLSPQSGYHSSGIKKVLKTSLGEPWGYPVINPYILHAVMFNYSQLTTFKMQVCFFCRKTSKSQEEQQREPERPEGGMTLSAKVKVLLWAWTYTLYINIYIYI